MECRKELDARKYVSRFDKILCNMADKMLSARPKDNITKYFIECMIPHHQAAIYMCENLLGYTDYQPLKEIARNIIRTQTIGIGQMREIYRSTMGYTNSMQDMNCYVEKYLFITRNMINRMKSAPRCLDINLNFVNEMIPHHEGAIAMCQNLLQYCIDPRLKIVANSIISEQSKGVRELQEIHQKLCR